MLSCVLHGTTVLPGTININAALLLLFVVENQVPFFSYDVKILTALWRYMRNNYACTSKRFCLIRQEQCLL